MRLLQEATSQDERNRIYSQGIYGALRGDVMNTPLADVTSEPIIVTQYTEEGSVRHLVPDLENGRIYVPEGGDGDYQIWFQVTFDGSTGKTFKFEVYREGVATGLICGGESPSTGAIVNTNMLGIEQDMVAGERFSVRVSNEGGGTATITIRATQFLVKRVF